MRRTSDLVRRYGAFAFCGLLAAGCGSSSHERRFRSASRNPGDRELHLGRQRGPRRREHPAHGGVQRRRRQHRRDRSGGERYASRHAGAGARHHVHAHRSPRGAAGRGSPLRRRDLPRPVSRARALADRAHAARGHRPGRRWRPGDGGNTSEFINTPDTVSTHRFDPITETVSPGPELAFSAEAGLTMPAQLDGGGFLLVRGGTNSPAVATQAFDAETGRFDRVGNLHFRHDAGTATALGDGSVLVAGGHLPAILAAERYDPASGQWGLVGDMVVCRRGHTATRLADSRVLIVGGQFTCCEPTGESFTSTAEIYDPFNGGFQPTGSLATARAFHEATLLPDGRVLVTGGIDGVSAATTTSTEIYDPSTGHFGPGGAMQVGRDGHSAILLTDGRVLVWAASTPPPRPTSSIRRKADGAPGRSCSRPGPRPR